jgi:hypothetical protein
MSGVTGGRHCELPETVNCATGRENGREYGTEKFLNEYRNQKSTGKKKAVTQSMRTDLVVSLTYLNMAGGKDMEACLSDGIVSPFIVCGINFKHRVWRLIKVY